MGPLSGALGFVSEVVPVAGLTGPDPVPVLLDLGNGLGGIGLLASKSVVA